MKMNNRSASVNQRTMPSLVQERAEVEKQYFKFYQQTVESCQKAKQVIAHQTMIKEQIALLERETASVNQRRMSSLVQKGKEVEKQYSKIKEQYVESIQKAWQVITHWTIVKEQIALLERKTINLVKIEEVEYYENSFAEYQKIQVKKQENGDGNGSVREPIPEKKKKKNISKIKTIRQGTLKSAKKNSKTNVINQLLSLLQDKSKSQEIVKQTVTTLKLSQGLKNKEEKISAFYSVLSQIIKLLGRYINTKTLFKCFMPNTLLQKKPDQAEIIFHEQEAITIEEFCCIFRTCTLKILKHNILPAIQANKRFGKRSKLEMMKERKEMIRLLEKIAVSTETMKIITMI